MKRSGPIARRTPLRSAGRIAPRKRTPDAIAEQAAKFEREFGSDARVRWIKYVLPCVGCGHVPNYDFPNDNAHTANDGKSRKGHHTTIAPLCATSIRGIGCHAKYDRWLAPFDTGLAREAVKVHAAVTDAQWTRMGETRRVS